MVLRIHEIQAHIITFIQNQTYHPTEPPMLSPIVHISRKKRERLEIYGDALLAERLIFFLFHEFPSQGAGFISVSDFSSNPP
jgi:hypothetical protein